MAIERIDSSFDIQALNAEFKAFIDGISNCDTALTTLYTTIKSYKGSTLGNIAAETARLDKASKDALASNDRLNKSLLQSEKTQAQALKTAQQRIKNEQESQKAIQAANKTKESAAKLEATLQREKDKTSKALERERAALDKSSNAYEILKKQYLDASNLSKKRGAELLVIANGNEKVYKSMLGQDEVYEAATDSAQRYYKQLELLEKEVGQHQRSVGNYAIANYGLSNSINQLTRELPAFTMNLNTGFLAISNNLPMFFDEVKKINMQNAQLASTGQKPVSVLKQLAGSFFSLQTALSVGVTLLTIYGGRLAEWVIEAVKGKDAAADLTDEYQKLTEAITEAASKSGGKEIATLKILRAEIESNLVPMDKRLQAIKDLKDEYPEYFKGLTNEQILTGKVGDAYDLAAQSIIRKAKANAAAAEIEKISSENLSIQLKQQLEAEEAAKKSREARDRTDVITGGSGGVGGTTVRVKKEDLQKEIADNLALAKSASDAEIAIGQKKIDFLVKFAIEGANETIKIDEKTNKEQEKLAKEAAELLRKFREGELESEAEYLALLAKLRVDGWQRIMNDDKSTAAERLGSMANFIEARKAQIDLELKQELDAISAQEKEAGQKDGSAVNARLLAAKNAEIAMTDLVIEMGAKRGDIVAKQLQGLKDEFKQFEDDFNAAPANQLSRQTADTTERFAGVDATNNLEQMAELDAQTELLKKKETNIEDYNKRVEAINEKYALRNLSNSIAYTEAILEDLKKVNFDKEDEQKAHLERIRKLEEDLLNKKIAFGKQDVAATKKTEDEKEKIRQEKLGKLGKLFQQVQEVQANALGAVGEILSISLDKQKVATEELEVRQQEAYEEEIKRINASGDTEEQKANRLKIAEAERFAQKSENERKQRKIEIDRARFEKVRDIGNIITGTAVAVVRALATGGPILAAVVGALGAAQLARAIATPLPKYEHGTDSAPGGWALTDEKGAEMYVEPGGKTYLGSNQGPVMRYLKPGTKVIPADEVNQQLNQSMMAATARQLMLAASYQREKESNTALNRIEEAILQGTDATLREMRRNKKQTKIINQIDTGFGLYLKEKTFN